MSSSPPPSIESASSSSNLGSPVTPATALSTSMITSDTSTTPSHQSPSSSSSLNDLADILIQKLDRSKIFPPHLNNPEQLMNLTRRSDERPPRPPNGFLLCRKNVHQEAKINGICNMRVISKVSGMLWRSASPDEKEQYEKLAIQVHNLHSEKYPNYKYRPNNTIVNTNLSHHHHHHNKLPSATFSPYGLPSPPYSNISTPTIATTLPYFHPNHHHYPGHHHPNHHLVNHHTNHQQLSHHSLSHHSLNNNNQNHHQLSHHSPLPHLPHLNHPLPHSQQQLKNITKRHTTNNHINHQSSSSSHPYANHHHHHHQFIPSSTTVATNNNNTLSPMLSLSSSLSPSSTTNTTTTTSPPSTNTTLYNLPIVNELEFSPEQIEMFVSYLSTNNNNNTTNTNTNTNNNYHNRQY